MWIGRLKMLLRLTSLMVLSAALLAFGMPILAGGGTVRISFVAAAGVIHACVQSFGFRMENGRFKRHLIDHSWLICFRCGYVLKGLPPQYQCPECDLTFDATELATAWKRWMGRQIVYSSDVAVESDPQVKDKSEAT